MRSKRIYVAGPYTRGHTVPNVRDAILAGDRLAQVGYAPYVPHISLLWDLLCPHPIEFWYQYDFVWLELCDCLLRLPGESAGADLEVRRAEELGIPIYWSIEEALEARPFMSRENEHANQT